METPPPGAGGTSIDDEMRRGPAGSDSHSNPSATVRIVVGVDGSPASQAALDFAVAEAAMRGGSVQAVHAWQAPVGDGGWVPPVTEYEIHARRVLDDAIARAAPPIGDGPVPVAPDLQEGHPAERLLAAAKDADLLVVGSRGRGGFVGLLLGSVSQYAVTHAACPVVVVRAPASRMS